MIFNTARLFAATALFGLSLVSAQNATEDSWSCGTVHDSDAIAAAEADFLKGVPHVRARRLAARAANVPVFWNVIMDGDQGAIDDVRIDAQMTVLNAAFLPVGLQFQRMNPVNRVQNKPWFSSAGYGTYTESQMKGQLGQKSPQVLNLYTSNLRVPFNGLLGYARFPFEYQEHPVLDGVVIDHTAITGGTAAGLSTGKILVHEVGHWVGLYHTFQGGCDGGDLVDDTPAESSPASGCPVGRDTCASAGKDPINNHMDYTNDVCRQLFTSGQYRRMAQAIREFRGINLF